MIDFITLQDVTSCWRENASKQKAAMDLID